MRPHQKTPIYQSELGGFEDCGINEYLAPNIEDALFWLQEHGYSVSGAYCYADKSYFYMVQYLRAEDVDTGCGFSEKPGFPTYEEAVSAGIEAALELLTEGRKERK